MMEQWQMLVIVLLATAAVLGGAVSLQLQAKADRAYCGSGAHADPCPGKYNSPWIYCGDPLAGSECMTTSDALANSLGQAVVMSGLVGAVLLFSPSPKTSRPTPTIATCPRCGSRLPEKRSDEP